MCNDLTAGGFLHHCRWQHQWQLGPGVRLDVSSEEPPEGACETTSQSPRETTSPAMMGERDGGEGRGKVRPEREEEREGGERGEIFWCREESLHYEALVFSERQPFPDGPSRIQLVPGNEASSDCPLSR